MDYKKIKELLSKIEPPQADELEKKRAISNALDEFEKRQKNPQGNSDYTRLTDKSSVIEQFINMIKGNIMNNNFEKCFTFASVLAVTVFSAIMFYDKKEVANKSSPGKTEMIAAQETQPESKESLADSAPQPQLVADSYQPIQQAESKQVTAVSAAPFAVANIPQSASRASESKSANVSALYQQDASYRPSPPIAQPQISGDKFKHFESNKFISSTDNPVSTFSIDVDTSSYAYVRKSINDGSIPPRDSIRTEELVNYFDYDYALPASKEAPFNSSIAIYPTPWNKNSKLIHIGIKGYDIDTDTKPRSNLVFLIDTSGSMEEPNKLPLLKSAFTMLIDNLDPDDTVGIVTYAGSAGVVLEPTSVSDKARIISALTNLNSGGSTAGQAGIQSAYDLAQKNFDTDSVNRIILATDGDFNVGISDPEQLKKLIEQKRDSGIFLSVLGFGQGNYNDELMQSLAQNGNGNAAYIDSLNEARKVLVNEASSTIFPIAKDVKLQMEFNPSKVAEYKLIGYETRALNREDFNNDKIDAGDIGSGHAVTAIYEIITTDSNYRNVDPLRYGQPVAAPQKSANNSDEYGFLKIRYKLPKESQSKLITQPVTIEFEKNNISSENAEVKFATSVAAFSMLIRGDIANSDISYDTIANLASEGKGKDEFGYRQEFINIIKNAQYLIQPVQPQPIQQYQEPVKQQTRYYTGPKMGLTWGAIDTPTNSERQLARVGCGGWPSVSDSSPSCNAYVGDTLCEEKKPILCINKSGLPQPAELSPAEIDRNYQWSGGVVALSPATEGTQLTSRMTADQICANSFGQGWRMAEHHDGWGWGFWAKGLIPSTERFWVAIKDQPANCWDDTTVRRIER